MKTRPVIDPLRGIAALPFVIAALLLPSACSAPVPEPTATARPPTPTAVAFPDLSPIFDDRRLRPPQATAVETTTVPHPSFRKLPQADRFVSAVYSGGAEFAGRVSIFMYANPSEMDAAWPLLLDLIVTPNEVPGVGELAAVDHSDMAFIRCVALVHIKLVSSDPVELRTYAEALDALLIPEVCKN